MKTPFTRVATDDTTVIENDRCECGHGSARHSEVGVPNPLKPGKRSHLCLISTCPCWEFRKEKL